MTATRCACILTGLTVAVARLRADNQRAHRTAQAFLALDEADR